MDFKLSKKVNDKWLNFGTIKLNKFGKPQVSIKVTPEFKQLVATNEWLNFALFENTTKKVDTHNTAKANAYQPEVDLNDSVPF